MIPLTAEEAGRALGLAPLAGDVCGISIDSRTIREGDLFVALCGERFDGHVFVDQALRAGASGAVVLRGTVAEGGPLYEVDDTLDALWALARSVRLRSRATVFAVTGSAGKTSTKDLLAAMVGRVRRVVATSANQNNEVGVPLTLLSIEPTTEAVVVEMGMRGRGQIAALAEVALPDVGVITNIHPVHLELLGTLEAIAQAKAELVRGLRPDGTGVIPADCSVLQPYARDSARRLVTWGGGSGPVVADVTGTLDVRGGETGCALHLCWPGGEVEIETPAMPEHAVANAVAAAAACYAAGLPVEECAKGIAGARLSAGRGEMLHCGGLWLIDDTYNANPAAVRAALDHLIRAAGARGGRPVAVLGDMLELGPEAEAYHEEAGAYAAAVGVKSLWGVGPLARATAQGFQAAWEAKTGCEGEWARGHVGSSEETSTIAAGLREGDVVLFKGSRGMHLEKMVQWVVEEAEAGRWSSRGTAACTEDEAKEIR